MDAFGDQVYSVIFQKISDITFCTQNLVSDFESESESESECEMVERIVIIPGRVTRANLVKRVNM